MNYLTERHWCHRPARFDVVAVKMLPGQVQIELIRNAFELC
jgi:Holliday junction resolvase-like predicted endonuclease